MAQTLTFRGSAAELRALLHAVPAMLAGRVPDPTGLVRGLQLRLGNAWLSQVQLDFLVKARGGTGRDGVRWPPLDPKTVAARKRTAADVAAFNRARTAAALRGERLTAVAFYGGRQLDIGIDTRRMMRSLTAGVEDRPAGNPDQVLRLGKGELVIGTNVPYTEAFHKGRPGRQPARPITPPEIPAAYWPQILAALGSGVRVILVHLVRSGR